MGDGARDHPTQRRAGSFQLSRGPTVEARDLSRETREHGTECDPDAQQEQHDHRDSGADERPAAKLGESECPDSGP